MKAVGKLEFTDLRPQDSTLSGNVWKLTSPHCMAIKWNGSRNKATFVLKIIVYKKKNNSVIMLCNGNLKHQVVLVCKNLYPDTIRRQPPSIFFVPMDKLFLQI